MSLLGKISDMAENAAAAAAKVVKDHAPGVIEAVSTATKTGIETVGNLAQTGVKVAAETIRDGASSVAKSVEDKKKTDDHEKK